MINGMRDSATIFRSVKTVDGHSSESTRRVLVLSLLDVAVAAVAAVLVFGIFGVVSVVETNPPVCYNAGGQVVSCSLRPAMVMLPTFGVVLLGLAAWHTSRRRERRG